MNYWLMIDICDRYADWLWKQMGGRVFHTDQSLYNEHTRLSTEFFNKHPSIRPMNSAILVLNHASGIEVVGVRILGDMQEVLSERPN